MICVHLQVKRLSERERLNLAKGVLLVDAALRVDPRIDPHVAPEVLR